MAGKEGSFQPNVISVCCCHLIFGHSNPNFVLPDVLDGAMVTLAMFTLNFAHPSVLLGDLRDSYNTAEKLRDSTSGSEVA
jgi:hypothetical protein